MKQARQNPDAPFESFPDAGTFCSVCYLPQRKTDGGLSCPSGHGGAAPLSKGRKVPVQKPGRSKQDYGTPKIFLDAVKKRFGIELFDWDLAATMENAVDGLGAHRQYFGPDRGELKHRDALAQDWAKIRGSIWCNPPFADIAPWAEKCAATTLAWRKWAGNSETPRIFFLVPAAVGSNWFQRHVFGKSLVLLLNPRISFDGKAGFPKDLVLAVYGLKPGVECWRWQGKPL